MLRSSSSESNTSEIQTLIVTPEGLESTRKEIDALDENQLIDLKFVGDFDHLNGILKLKYKEGKVITSLNNKISGLDFFEANLSPDIIKNLLRVIPQSNLDLIQFSGITAECMKKLVSSIIKVPDIRIIGFTNIIGMVDKSTMEALRNYYYYNPSLIEIDLRNTIFEAGCTELAEEIAQLNRDRDIALETETPSTDPEPEETRVLEGTFSELGL